MFELLDRIAYWWLDHHLSQKTKQDIQEFQLKKLHVDESGFESIISFPGVAILADEAAALLDTNKAKNYVQFDMLPYKSRPTRRAIRVTIQWAGGMSPATKAAWLEKMWDEAITILRDWPTNHPLFEQAMQHYRKWVKYVDENEMDGLK